MFALVFSQHGVEYRSESRFLDFIWVQTKFRQTLECKQKQSKRVREELKVLKFVDG